MSTIDGEESPRSPIRRGWQLRGPGLLLVALWLLLLAWQWVEHAGEVARHKAALQHAGEASLRTLEASLRSMGRGRRQRPEFLQSIFEEAAKVPDVRGIWLWDSSGRLVFSSGPDRKPPDLSEFGGVLWEEDSVLVGLQADIGECPFDGRGQPRSTEAQESPLYLFLSLDRSGLDSELAATLRLRAVALATMALAVVVALLLLRGRERNRVLQTDLAVVEERARQHREWALLGAGLAHETKNPLSVIRGLAQRLSSEDCQHPACVERARDIVDEADRVVARINEFLNYSRPVEPRPEEVRLRRLLQEMASLVESDMAASGGRVVNHAADLQVRADPGMLRQILLNLLVNAARVLPPGGTVLLRTIQADDGSLTLEVADNGSGIPEADRERVFEPYYSRAEGGTGLGLAIVRRLVELQGWTIRCEAVEGGGARFCIHGMNS